MSVSASTPGASSIWWRRVFGGAGPRTNAARRELIDQVKWDLERWRDTDNPEYLASARRLLEQAS